MEREHDGSDTTPIRRHLQCEPRAQSFAVPFLATTNQYVLPSVVNALHPVPDFERPVRLLNRLWLHDRRSVAIATLVSSVNVGNDAG